MSEEDQIDNVAEEPKEGLSEAQTLELETLQPDYVPGEDQPKGPSSADMLGAVISGVFAVLSARLGDHWVLSNQEVRAIAEPANMVIEKYIPNFESGPELALVAAVGMVVIPRVVVTQRIAEERSKDGSQSEPVTTE